MRCSRFGQFTASFDTVFEDCGLRILRSPPQAPRANAVCERLIGTLLGDDPAHTVRAAVGPALNELERRLDRGPD